MEDARRWALFGTGEFEDWGVEVLRAVCGDGPVAMVSVNQVENGAAEVERFRAIGSAAVATAGLGVRVVPLLSKDDADSDRALASLDGAGALYVQGGGPTSGVETLSGSQFWASALDRAMPYVGSSGGAMMLGCCFPDLREPSDSSSRWAHGLRASVAAIAPHWDELDQMEPGLQATFVARTCRSSLLGIDRQTAVVIDGSTCTVFGEGQAHLWSRNTTSMWRAGETFEFALFG